MKLTGKTALITGAGSGIGRALAEVLAQRGCHLALVDINPEGLAATAGQVGTPGLRVSSHHVDVSDRKAVKALPAAVLETHGGIDLLINNAGVAAGGNFQQISEETFDWLMAINFHAVVHMTRVFLPHLQQREEAHIVNMSSLFGLIAPVEQTAYAASKFAVRGFSAALRHELEGSPVGVTVIHPGGVNTRIAKDARIPEGISPEEVEVRLKQMEKLLHMPPGKAAEIIVKGIEKKKARIIVGRRAKAVALLERLVPVDYWKVITWLAKQPGK